MILHRLNRANQLDNKRGLCIIVLVKLRVPCGQIIAVSHCHIHIGITRNKTIAADQITLRHILFVYHNRLIGFRRHIHTCTMDNLI